MQPAYSERVAARVSFEDEVVAAMGRDRDPRFGHLDDAAVEAGVRSGAAEIAAATCRWLELIAELVVRGIWAQQGARTPAQWLSWAVSMGASTARAHVRVALRLADFPQVADRFRAGELSYCKVRAIVRLREPALERLLLDYARYATGADLERIVVALSGVETAKAARTADLHAAREVRWDWTDEGMLKVVAYFPPEQGLVVTQHLEAQGQRLSDDARADRRAQRAARDAGDDTVGPVDGPLAYRADALVAALETVAVSGPVDTSGADTHLVVIHADADDLAAPPEGGDRAVSVRGASAEARAPGMSARALRRLACDARLAVVGHDTDDQACAASGTTRRVPARIRRILWARDRGCRFPGCTRTRNLHAHHIIHWIDDGPTEPENLVLLCAFHHTFVHERGWTILHDGAGRFRFAPPGAPILPPALPLPGAGADPVATIDPADDDRRHLRPSALQSHRDAHPLDLNACVAALQQELERLQPPPGTEQPLAA